MLGCDTPAPSWIPSPFSRAESPTLWQFLEGAQAEPPPNRQWGDPADPASGCCGGHQGTPGDEHVHLGHYQVRLRRWQRPISSVLPEEQSTCS